MPAVPAAPNPSPAPPPPTQGQHWEQQIEQVGPRLRGARLQRGFTLEELATATGLSASTLSRLESGKRRANLELLLPVTQALGVRLDDLLAAAPDPRVRRGTIRRHDTAMTPLTPENAPVDTYRMTLEPPQRIPEQRVHDGFEWLYVLTGQLRLHVGDQFYTLKRAEAAQFDTRTPHAFWAHGNRPVQLISIFNHAGVRLHTYQAT